VLIAIEGVDGAGKRTLSAGLQKAFESAGMSVVTLAFPRYGRSVTADVAAEALHGEHGDLASSVYAMAMLFALDRAGAIGEIEGLRRDYDVVLMDRYVASNAAYSAARRPGSIGSNTSGWRCPPPTGRCCLRSPPSSPGGGPGTAPSTSRAGRATATNATTNCSGAPAPSTPSWPPPAGAGGGSSSTPTSIRARWRRL
jgi:dTMP kinase